MEGSEMERYFYGVLTLIGLWILRRRGFRWGDALRLNPWLTALMAYMAASILWSHYPYVSFKRYIKVIGSVVMAYVILTEPEPLKALSTVIRRCLYIHLPMSIICIKYFRNLGVSYDWSGVQQSWQGICSSKNVLGQVATLGVIFFFMEIRRHWPELKWRNPDILFLGMAIYLLKGAEGSVSMTSVSVCLFALVVFIRIQSLRSRPELIRPFVKRMFFALAGAVSLVIAHSIVFFPADSFFGHIITFLGRDITLTDRTKIWSSVYQAAAATGNPLFGVGFGGFWIGRIANIAWNAHMTWVLAQAHSGYVDTYLQLGYIGAFLLAAVIFTAPWPMIDSMSDDFDFGSVKITLFLTIVFIDMTETIYLRGDHHLWLLLMIVLWRVPQAGEALALQPQEDENVQPKSEGVGSLPTWN
jgi:hypothetical protein